MIRCQPPSRNDDSGNRKVKDVGVIDLDISCIVAIVANSRCAGVAGNGTCAARELQIPGNVVNSGGVSSTKVILWTAEALLPHASTATNVRVNLPQVEGWEIVESVEVTVVLEHVSLDSIAPDKISVVSVTIARTSQAGYISCGAVMDGGILSST